MYSVFKYACVVTKIIHVLPLLTSVYVYVLAVYQLAWLCGGLRSCLRCGGVHPAGFLIKAIFSQVGAYVTGGTTGVMQ